MTPALVRASFRATALEAILAARSSRSRWNFSAGRGYSTAGLRSKNWNEFASAEAAPLDLVITVCDQAAAETCPIWPSQPMTAHWSVPDPASVTGSVDDQRSAYRDAMRILRRRIEFLAALPIDTLSRLALQERVRSIGRM